MRKNIDFFRVYGLLVVGQLLICNYFHLTPYIMLTILPTMVLCIPLRFSTPVTLAIAFGSALLVDLLSDGVAGLNLLALLPVAYLRQPLIRAVFGDGLFAREEDFSLRRSGVGKVATLLFLGQAIFLSLYVWADGAGVRPFWFNAVRFSASLLAGWLLSFFVVDLLSPDDRR